jgi:hypothetical protein
MFPGPSCNVLPISAPAPSNIFFLQGKHITTAGQTGRQSGPCLGTYNLEGPCHKVLCHLGPDDLHWLRVAYTSYTIWASTLEASEYVFLYISISMFWKEKETVTNTEKVGGLCQYCQKRQCLDV